MYTKTIPISNISVPNEHIDLLPYEELVTLSGGSPKALGGWKAAAFLVGGTFATVILVACATYFIYKGVKYFISD